MAEKEVGTGTVATAAAPESKSSGMFDHLAIPGAGPEITVPEETPKETSTEKPTVEATVTESEPNAEGTPAEKPEATVEPKLWGGRYETPEQLEEAYGLSSKEGVRLSKELEEAEDVMSKMEEELAVLKAGLDLPQFQELSESDYQKLYEEDPKKAFQYLVQKELHEKETTKLKAEREQEAKDQIEEQKQVKSRLNYRIDEMLSAPSLYPEYKSLQPLMMEIVDKTNGDLAGHIWTPDILYYAAYGYTALQKSKAASSASAKDKSIAADKAKAAAAQAGSSGSTTTSAPTDADDDSDEAFNKRLISKAPTSRLFG